MLASDETGDQGNVEITRQKVAEVCDSLILRYRAIFEDRDHLGAQLLDVECSGMSGHGFFIGRCQRRDGADFGLSRGRRKFGERRDLVLVHGGDVFGWI
jgi:hypothetical protein